MSYIQQDPMKEGQAAQPSLGWAMQGPPRREGDILQAFTRPLTMQEQLDALQKRLTELEIQANRVKPETTGLTKDEANILRQAIILMAQKSHW